MKEIRGGKAEKLSSTSDEGLTFYKDALPIIGENCHQCHNSTQPMGGTFPLETYEQVAASAEVLLSKMQAEGDDQKPFFMPPFYAKSDAECTPPLPRGL